MVAGFDGCKEGWIAVLLDDDGALQDLRVGLGLQELLESMPTLACAGVDMPLHLMDAGQRPADVAARRQLGGIRGRSVFPAPPALILESKWFGASHAEVTAECRRRHGSGVPAQSLALRGKIREVNDAFRKGWPVIEVHPELSFWAMNGGSPLSHRKKSWGGFHQRRKLLLGQGIRIPESLPEAISAIASDDILDAAAAAWSALRHARRESEGLPDATAQPDAPVIWY